MAANGGMLGKVGRAGAALALASAALTASTAPVAAQVLGTDGKVSAYVTCQLATNTAHVVVYAENPSVASGPGLVYYGRIWAKGELDRDWSLISEGQTGTINTWRNNGFVTFNLSTWIFQGDFSGSDGSYEVYVQYWIRWPDSSTWGPLNGFNVNTDRNSTIDTFSWAFGGLGDRTSTCNL